MSEVNMSLQKLAEIADAYERNELDDEARRFWGTHNAYENSCDKSKIVLYSGRGGKTLLTLQDCFDAREAIKSAKQLERLAHPRDALDM